MTSYQPKRLGRGDNLHRIADDVQGFGEWLLFLFGLVAVAAGVAFIVAVVGFGWRAPLQFVAQFIGGPV